MVKKIKLIFQVYFTPCVLQISITGDKIFTNVDGESYVDNVWEPLMHDNAIGQQYRRAKRARSESLVGPDVVGLPIVRICNKTHHKENIASINHHYALWTILLVIKKRVRCFGFTNESQHK